MTSLLSEIRIASRGLARRPGFTAVVVLTLALGLGANAAIFSVVDAVLLRPLPYREPQRLAMVWEANRDRKSDRNVVSPANFLDWRAQNGVFEEMAAAFDWHANLTGLGEPEEVSIELATASLFPLLGVQPALGRVYTAREDLPNGEPVVLLSDAFWRRRFGADRGVVGRTVTLNGKPRTVLGVMPPGFRVEGRPAEPALWAPLRLDPAQDYRQSVGRYIFALGRLKPGVTAERAGTEMRTIARRLEEAHPQFNTGWSVNVVPLEEQVIGGVRRALLVLSGVVGFVLLIACANVANLQLAQASAREREIAVRAALGAGGWRLARQLLVESVLLALAGGALGVLLAFWGTAALTAAAPAAIPRVHDVSLDARALGVTAALSLLAALLFGFLPALQVARGDLHDALKSGGRGAVAGRSRLRSTLVVVQVALSLVLLVGAGLMLKSFARLQGVSPGFDPERLLTAKVTLSGPKYESDARQTAFFQQLLERVAAEPGVRAAGAINWLPLSGLRSATDYTIAGRPAPRRGEEPGADVRAVDPAYFRAMGIPLLRGTTFNGHELPDARTKTVVISESLARAQFPGQDPLGQRILMEWGDTLTGEIVGVVGDVRHIGLDSIAPPTIYWALPQFPSPFMTLVVRTAGDPMRSAGAVRRAVWSLDPDLPVADVKPMESYLGDSVARRRFTATLLATFAALALSLAAVGLYGVVSYSVAQHTREFGIRMALGASATAVRRGVMRQSLLLAVAGVVAGILGALALTRLLASLLYDVSATDPTVFAGIAAVLTGVALAAAYVPARRATRVDPMEALRYE
ncbi:MAG: ABC transporter permease [Gemmatimonadaceae bacterium]